MKIKENFFNKLEGWLQKRYNSLLEEFQDRNFTFEEATDYLRKTYRDSVDEVKVILSRLKEAGLLTTKRSKEDMRKKIYKLNSISKEPSNTKKLTPSKQDLINLLKQAADIIRTRVDYTFILLLLFYKTLSDKWQKEFNRIKQELISKGWSEKDAEKEASKAPYHTFNFPQDYLWDNIRKDHLKVTERLSVALKKLADDNPDYQDIFLQFNFAQFTNNPENTAILNQLVETFSTYSFEDVETDILGDAYEWLLRYFAPTKAKEGEVFTPREVIKLMVEILDPKPTQSIYDPCFGSGGMLIVAHQHIKEKYGPKEAKTLLIYGQEVNPKTVAIAKMNVILHGIINAQLLTGDTLLYPKFKQGSALKKFDYTIANPPWNQDGYDEETLKKGELWKERFTYGFTTKQSADWIWIQHMLASTKDDGKLTIVIDTGAVSRGGKEKQIRQKFIENDLIESVILLPEKLFYNTQAPAVILVITKNKPQQRKGKILLINASKEYQPGKRQNALSDENIKKVVEVYKEFKEIENFSKIITLKDAQEADYNLSPSRFIPIIEEEVYRPIEEIKRELESLEEQIKDTNDKISGIINKLWG